MPAPLPRSRARLRPYTSGSEVTPRYRVSGLLAEGALGLVYVARNVETGERVALKTLRSEYLARPDLVARFDREAWAVRALRHAHIVRYHDHGRDAAGSPFLVTELLEGRTGAWLVTRHGALTWRQLVRALSQVCDAVECAHQQNIIHRDLKWSNVMVTSPADAPLYLKLLDFGVLKYAVQSYEDDPVDPDAPDLARRITSGGVVVGTPDTVSPEQVLGRPVDVRSDVYSLGVMGYELVTGRKPFHAANRADLLLMHVRARPTPPHEIAPVPEPLSAALMRALAKDPSQRFSSAIYLSRALKAAIRHATGAPAAKGPGIAG